MINNEPCSRFFSLYNSTPSYQGDWKIRTPRRAGCLELWKLYKKFKRKTKQKNGNKLYIFTVNISTEKRNISPSISHPHIQCHSSLTVLVCFAAEAFDQILFLYVVFGKQWVATLYLSAGKNCEESRGGHWNSHHRNSDYHHFQCLYCLLYLTTDCSIVESGEHQTFWQIKDPNIITAPVIRLFFCANL